MPYLTETQHSNLQQSIIREQRINGELLEACKEAFNTLRPQYRAWGKDTVMGKLESVIIKAEVTT